MKTKYLLIALGITFILLLYNIFCYSLVNNIMENQTKNVINEYFINNKGINDKYEYIKTLNNKDNSISVYVKLNNEYYNFNLSRTINGYQINTQIILGIYLILNYETSYGDVVVPFPVKLTSAFRFITGRTPYEIDG